MNKYVYLHAFTSIFIFNMNNLEGWREIDLVSIKDCNKLEVNFIDTY